MSQNFFKKQRSQAYAYEHRHHHQQLVHQHVSPLQNNYTLNVTLKIKAEEEVSSRCIVESNLDTISGRNRKTRISDMHFLLCQSCFWCASYTSPFDKLIISLRTAVAEENILDKESTSYADVFDAYRLALKHYQFITKEIEGKDIQTVKTKPKPNQNA